MSPNEEVDKSIVQEERQDVLLEESIPQTHIPSFINKEEYIRTIPDAIIPPVKEYKINPNYLVIQLAKKKNRLTAKDQANLNLNENSIDKLTTEYLSTFTVEQNFEMEKIEMKPMPLFHIDETKILPPEYKLKHLSNEIFNLQRKSEKENYDKLALKEKILLMNLENEELKARQLEKQKRLDEIFSDY